MPIKSIDHTSYCLSLLLLVAVSNASLAHQFVQPFYPTLGFDQVVSAKLTLFIIIYRYSIFIVTVMTSQIILFICLVIQ